MNIGIVLAITLVLFFTLGICFFLARKNNNLVSQVESLNNQLNEYRSAKVEQVKINAVNTALNEQLEQQVEDKQRQLTELAIQFDELNDTFIEQAKENARAAHVEQVEVLNKEFSTKEKELREAYAAQEEELKEQLKNLESIVEGFKQKQQTIINARLRQEELENKTEFYKMSLSIAQIKDIEFLRQDVQPRLSNKELLDKLIWEGYYKPEYDKLMSRLFGADKNNRCGIYKITNIVTQKSYIGQSVSLSTRLKDHIRAGLAYEPSSNRLYADMQLALPENFTFEILEEVPREQLDEREKYWIEFYGTQLYGLNTMRGVNI